MTEIRITDKISENVQQSHTSIYYAWRQPGFVQLGVDVFTSSLVDLSTNQRTADVEAFPLRLLPGRIFLSLASQQGLYKECLPMPTQQFCFACCFLANKWVAEVKSDASVSSTLIYKAIRGRRIITLPLLGTL